MQNLKRILVAEDDEFFRNIICDVLGESYEVIQAPNGITAREILLIQDVDLVISDVQMPGFTGIELLEWSTKNKPVPFIIMTGFSTLLETRSASELGAQAFITKPFKITELILKINTVLKIGNKPIEEKKDSSHFCKVSIDEFVTRPLIDFDVYIKLSEKNIIKIANKGEELPRQQLNQYKAKGVKFLHILKEDFGKLIHFNLDLVKIMKSRSDVPQEKKAAFLKYTGEVLLEGAFTDGIDEEILADVNSFLKLTHDVVAESQECVDLLGIISDHSDQVYAHSLGVSMYSVLIAKQMDMISNVNLFKLSMAGLFHDIGKKEIEKELLLKPRHLLTKNERNIIESHVIRGQEILSSMKDIPPDVIRIVSEHHEDLEGMGYPSRKTKRDQHPLSRIIQCSNIFLNKVNEVKADKKPVVVASILEFIESLYGTRVDAECVQALKKIFNIKSSRERRL